MPRKGARRYIIARLQSPPFSRQEQPDSRLRGRRLLFVLVSTASLTTLGIGVIAVFCFWLIPPIPHGAEFEAQFTILDGFFYHGQPAKTAAYQAGCIATPFLLALSFFWAWSGAKKLSDGMVDRVNGIGLVLYLMLMASCLWPILYCPHPPFWILPPSWILLPMQYSHPFYKPERILLLLAAAAAEYYFLVSPPSRRNANLAMVLLLAIWAVLIPSRFYLPNEIDDRLIFLYHLNSVLDALSQSVNGHHLLIDFPHMYGGYIEMLAPVIRLFPREIGVLIVALAVPSVLGMLCLLLTARLVIRRPAFLFVAGLALLGVGCLSTNDDLFYGYLTTRIFFTSAGLLAVTFYFRSPGVLRYVVATAVPAQAPVWNIDTGLVLWASWLVTLLAMELTARNLPGMVRHLLIQTLALAAVWSAFFIYLWLVSGQWPDGGLLFYFQKLVVDSGYSCLRLLFPDMWVFILTIYLTGLVVFLCASIRAHTSWLKPVLLMFSIFGIGIFGYFMGRSAPSNLVAVSYPAVLLAAIFCTEGEAKMQEGHLPKSARFFLLPAKIALFWWAFLMVAALPDFLPKSEHVVRNWNNAQQSELQAKAAFVSQLVRPGEEGVFFLSNHCGIYYYLSDTVRSVKIPGVIELVRARDMDILIHAIQNRQILKLFVDQNFTEIQMYRPEVYQKLHDAIGQNYLASAVGPAGRLILYTPR